jgi:hypothetical protein
LAQEVFARMAAYTAFPWPVLMAQCRRCKLDPGSLDTAGLRQLLDGIAASVARFAGPSKGKKLRAELSALAPEASESP